MSLLEALAQFKAKYNFAEEEEPQAKPCRIPDCKCTHLICDRGWIEALVDDTWHVGACRQCRPKLWWVWNESGDDREKVQDRLHMRNTKIKESVAAKSQEWRTLI